MNVNYKELYAIAQTIVEAHGRNAEKFAINVLDGFTNENDVGFTAVWQGILQAIKDIQQNTGMAVQ